MAKAKQGMRGKRVRDQLDRIEQELRKRFEHVGGARFFRALLAGRGIKAEAVRE